MQPGPPPPGPNTSPGRIPAPKPVRALSVLLWISAGLSSAVFASLITIMPREQGGLEYAIWYSFFHTVVGLLLAVPAAPITRGRPWARRTAKVLLILQTVYQAGIFISTTPNVSSLFLLPLAITGLVLLGRPAAKWYFAVMKPGSGQGAAPQYGDHAPHQGVNAGYFQPQQYPQQQYHPQGYWAQGPQSHAQPPQDGHWGPPPQR